MLVKQLDELYEATQQASDRLAVQRRVPGEVRRAIGRVTEARESSTESELETLDPYLVMALDSGLLAAWRAFESPAGDQRRRRVRVAVEQVRQALRDIREDGAVSDARPVKDVAGWIDDALDSAQADIAGLLGVSLRQYQRWVSKTDAAAPRGEDAQRVRVLARLVSHLRHALTGPGVVAWLATGHPALDGAAPASLLGRADQITLLRRLAASMRSTRAA
ncbi:MAG TPA: hypothetical protein VML96_13850 [Egibacteraceae bacterium]|nr:hypothetical protein [Egibacteraceae bacterium]